MSYKYDTGDPRAHTTFEEKEQIANDLLDRTRKLMVADQPEGTPACNECAAATLMLALGLICEQIRETGGVDEMLGVARRLIKINKVFDPLAADLLKRVADRDMAYLEEHADELSAALQERKRDSNKIPVAA